ncbi:hypothetical protein RRG08_016776 [Elysia crispata]|uniref:Uncharacterized protein n=1 Tax=Elysia crispata TaxID=231223 RepID=A0AAE0ZZV2_9GAST|nr:hypothetical protein RRG08_016776 [Elysia crispata]
MRRVARSDRCAWTLNHHIPIDLIDIVSEHAQFNHDVFTSPRTVTPRFQQPTLVYELLTFISLRLDRSHVNAPINTQPPKYHHTVRVTLALASRDGDKRLPALRLRSRNGCHQVSQERPEAAHPSAEHLCQVVGGTDTGWSYTDSPGKCLTC